jgi:hypothetical protein
MSTLLIHRTHPEAPSGRPEPRHRDARGEREDRRPIVAAVDGSAGALSAARTAARIAGDAAGGRGVV